MFMPTAETFARAEAVLPALLSLNPMSRLARVGGLAAATLVETGAGWRAAGALCAGMRVQTWDGGRVELVEVRQRVLAGGTLVEVPAGVIGNCSDLCLLPGQRVMIRSDAVEEVFAASGALVEARSLIGFRGTFARTVTEPVAVVDLVTAGDELVWAQTGALVRSDAAKAGAGLGAGVGAVLPILDEAQARALLELIEMGVDGPWARLPLAA